MLMARHFDGLLLLILRLLLLMPRWREVLPAR